MQQSVTISSHGGTPTLQKGWDYHQAGQYALAEETFRRFLDANPTHAQARRLLGLTCHAQNKFAEAEASFREALRLNPADAETHNELGAALAMQGKLAPAVASFEQARRLQPNNLAVRNNLVQAFIQQGLPDKAVQHAREIVQLQPANPDTHNQLGATLTHQGHFDQALNSFEQALLLKPDHQVARSNLDKTRFLLQQRGRNETNQLLGAIYFNQIMSMGRYADAKRLTQFGYKVYSQGYGDGMLQEVFRRIGTGGRQFIEIGTEPQENNTLYLLMSGWKGLWLDARSLDLRPLTHHVTTKSLRFAQVVVTKDNVNDVVREQHGTGEIDLLSVDISGHDYWVWKALTVVSPRVVVIEYNSSFSPAGSLAVDPGSVDYLNLGARLNDFGASLKAYEKLGMDKGYRLVGCDLRGVDAIFVREDLVSDHFCEPFTAENHYEPPRFFPPRLPLQMFIRGEFKEL